MKRTARATASKTGISRGSTDKTQAQSKTRFAQDRDQGLRFPPGRTNDEEGFSDCEELDSVAPEVSLVNSSALANKGYAAALADNSRELAIILSLLS